MVNSPSTDSTGKLFANNARIPRLPFGGFRRLRLSTSRKEPPVVSANALEGSELTYCAAISWRTLTLTVGISAGTKESPVVPYGGRSMRP